MSKKYESPSPPPPTKRANAFMMDHILGKRSSPEAPPRNPSPVETKYFREDEDEGDRSSANTSPVISSNFNKNSSLDPSFQLHLQNSYNCLRDYAKSSRSKESNVSSTATNLGPSSGFVPISTSNSGFTGKPTPSPNSSSTSASPIDLAQSSTANNFYQRQLQNAQYYPYTLPLGFPGSVGGHAGNFGFQPGFLSAATASGWPNPFLGMTQDPTAAAAAARQSAEKALFLSLHNGRIPYGVQYGPPRSYSSLTSFVSKRKGGQIRFNNFQTTQLEKAFKKHVYLNANDRRKLAATLVLTDRQVKTWFQNRRAKCRKSKDTIVFEHELQATRASAFAAQNSPDEGRCESVTELDNSEQGQEQIPQRRSSTEPDSRRNVTSGGKIYMQSKSSTKLYRTHSYRNLSGSTKIISVR